MPAALSLPSASLPLQDSDLIYLTRGTGAGRDVQAPISAVVDKVGLSDNEFTGVNSFAHSPGHALATIGSVSSGAIPLYTLDASTPRYLHNLDYVYLGTLGMDNIDPREWIMTSGAASAHITVEDYTVPCFTITVAGVMAPHLVGSGAFSVTSPFVRVVWNGIGLFFIDVAA